ncbi:MAG: beta-lactamase family protein [Ignavibacteria bacterium]|nr:beta-lactamase family protein [Ignavibacteria bacterium]
MKKEYKSYFLLLLMLCCFFFSCDEDVNGPASTNSNIIYSIPEETGDGWETASVSSVGLSEIKLLEMLGYLQGNPDHKIHSIIIIKNSKLVFEEYYEGQKFNLGQYTGESGFDREDTHNLCSATKSFVSACIGIAIDKGIIQSVDQEIYNFFPEHSDLFQNNPIKKTITLKHLLSMSSGIRWDDETYYYNDPRNDIYQLFTVSDPIRYILSKDIIETPGIAYAYRNCNTNLLGEIIRRASGQRLDVFAENYLFSKLKITEYEWQMLRNNVVFCSGDLRLRPRDMAKFGQIFFNGGTWDQEQIISVNWINESVQTRFFMPGNWWEDGYGYQWWTKTFYANSKSYGSYFAQGWGGQCIFVFPESNVIVVLTGGNYFTNSPMLELISSYILPAIN